MIDRRAPFSKVAIRRLEYMSKVDSPSATGWDSVLPIAMCREDPRVALAHLRIILPSDAGWRDTNYQRLVDIQRSLNAASGSAPGAAPPTAATTTCINRKPAVSPEPAMADAVESAEREVRDGATDDDDDDDDTGEEGERGGGGGEDEDKKEEEEPTKRPRSTATAVLQQQAEEMSSSHQLSAADAGLKDEVGRGGVFWSNADLMMAARLVSNYSATQDTAHAQNTEKQQHKPPVSLLKDPEQMRRVYMLIYDVLRYKPVLSEALNHLNFMAEHPQWQDDMQLLICLFFYNLYRKEFRYQEPIVGDDQDETRRLKEVNDLLWQYRVRLGAIVSRMRIAREAYDLEQLLPQHLINARSKVNDRIVCGWINYFKAKPRDVFAELDAFGLSHLPEGSGDQLRPLTYKLDHILPRFLHAMPKSRHQFTCSSLFIDNKVIMQERTFCLGPASVAQLLVDLALTGVVAQTHVSSLVTVAYLANLLATNEKVDGLIVFGAGSRKELCEEYLMAVGVTNTTVHAASFSELSADSEVLANVVTVLATPPNSNSHVVDAVDLAVARGGDLHLLHQLTQETFHTSSQGHTQVMHTMLTEQRDTLRMSMSKPQIQFVVYETHSRYDLENSEMVVRVITEMNGYATEKHLEEQRKRRYGGGGTSPQDLSGGTEGGSSFDLGQPSAKMAASEEDNQLIREQSLLPFPPAPEEITINVPACDLFELSPLPELCPHRDECLKLEEEGTYIAVIKRKEITRLDPKYMIEMAESRGLFGSKGGGGGEDGGGRRGAQQRRKAAAAAQRMQRSRSGGSDSADRNHKSKVKVELDRIAAPTHASMVRDVRFKVSASTEIECPRHRLHLSGTQGRPRSDSRARLWWRQLGTFVLDLIRDQVDLTLTDTDVDLPRLRLSRPKYRPVLARKTVSQPRSPFPIHLNYIEFQSDDEDDCDDDQDILQLCPCLASVMLTSAPTSLFTDAVS